MRLRVKVQYPGFHLRQVMQVHTQGLPNGLSEWIESSPLKKDLAVLVYGRQDVIWQGAFAAQKCNCILGCIKNHEACRLRKMIFPLWVLYLALEPSCQKGMDLLEQVQRRVLQPKPLYSIILWCVASCCGKKTTAHLFMAVGTPTSYSSSL